MKLIFKHNDEVVAVRKARAIKFTVEHYFEQDGLGIRNADNNRLIARAYQAGAGWEVGKWSVDDLIIEEEA